MPNHISKILKGAGYIAIVFGILLLLTSLKEPFTAITIGINGILGGVFFLGLSAIIDLLIGIRSDLARPSSPSCEHDDGRVVEPNSHEPSWPDRFYLYKKYRIDIYGDGTATVRNTKFASEDAAKAYIDSVTMIAKS